MLTLKEMKKIPYEELDEDSKEYLYQIFKRYVVRKQIADANKELTSLFVSRFGNNPREFSKAFNEFNSCFVGSNLIRNLHYDEIHTDYLKRLDEDAFNAYLERNGGSFDRKIALMCFSMRPSERIANRVEFPVMVAYANMQTLVFERARRSPNKPLYEIFAEAAKEIRAEFAKANGRTINSTKIAEKREDYKSLGKKAAVSWKQMLEFYQKGLLDFEALETANFYGENFVFTAKAQKYFDKMIQGALKTASDKVAEDRLRAEIDIEENLDTYVPADYDEVMSRGYADEIYSDQVNKALDVLFREYLKDPIFAEKEAKKRGE